jgi:hypothetical protein
MRVSPAVIRLVIVNVGLKVLFILSFAFSIKIPAFTSLT